MSSADRRRARALYRKSRFWALTGIGFWVATLVYPALNPSDHRDVLPSTVMAGTATITMVVCLVWASMLWRRDR